MFKLLYLQSVQQYCLSRELGDGATQNAVLKKPFLDNNNVLYRTSNMALEARKNFRHLDKEFYKYYQNFKFCLPYSPQLQTSTWLSLYDARIISLVGCAFWGSDECAPSFPLSSIWWFLSSSLCNIEMLIFVSTLSLSNLFKCHNVEILDRCIDNWQVFRALAMLVSLILAIV